MPESMFEKELETARRAAVLAGRRIMEFYSMDDEGVRAREKGERPDNPVTEADKAANDIIISELKKEFSHPILTEESEDDRTRLESSTVWIIDPLDGTKEFIRKLDEFTVNIALVRDNEPVLGVIFVPAKGDLYHAVRGGGAFHCRERCGKEMKGIEGMSASESMSVSGRDRLGDMMIVKSRFHVSEKLADIIKKAGFADSMTSGSSVKGCLVADGKADVYIRLGNVHEWDICAMDIIVREAGGAITDLRGKPLKYNKPFTLIEGGFVVSNNRAHEELLEAVAGCMNNGGDER
ncbi:MAG: 3'(2'),5'-bisphosphate nucleotidase CysQ [Candidatus Woesearchaeota archaeon]